MNSINCIICNDYGARYCSQCRSAAYCSVECQQTDFRLHRLVCESFAIISKKRPSPNHRLAIHFPAESIFVEPECVWIAITSNAPAWDGHERAEVDHYLKEYPDESGHISRTVHLIHGNTLRGGQQDHTIELTMRDDDEGPFNQCLASVGEGEWPSWRGSMVMMAKKGMDENPAFYQDISLVDLRDVVDYLSWFRRDVGSAIDGVGADTHFAKDVVLPSEAGKVLGVRLNCQGDQEVRGLPEFQQVLVPRRHPLFNVASYPPASIAKYLELGSLCGKRYPPHFKWRDEEDLIDRYLNPIAELLLVDLEKGSKTWGRPTRNFEKEIGSVLLVNSAKVDLKVEEVQQLYRFMRDWLQPRMQQVMNLTLNSPRQRALQQQLHPQTFQQFLEQASDTVDVV